MSRVESDLKNWYLQESLESASSNVEKMKDFIQQSQNVDELKERHLQVLEEVESFHTKLMERRQIRFDIERSQWRKRESFLEAKICVYERQILELRELREASQKGCPQMKQPDTAEIQVQTDLNMHTIHCMERKIEGMQEDFDILVHSYKSKALEYNRKKQELEEKLTNCDAELKAAQEELVKKDKAMQKANEEWLLKKEKDMQRNNNECKELKEAILEQHLAMNQAMVQRNATQQKECQILKKTVELLKDVVAQKDKICEKVDRNYAKSQVLKQLLDNIQEENSEVRPLIEEICLHTLQEQCIRSPVETVKDLSHQTAARDADSHSVRSKHGFQRMEKLEGKANVPGASAPPFTPGAHEATVSELRRALQEEAELRESSCSYHGERERAWAAQLKSWEEERASMMNQVNWLFQERVNMEHFYKQQLEHLTQREDRATNWFSELTDTKTQLEKELQEAKEKEKEWSLKELRWNKAKEKHLQLIDHLMSAVGYKERKKQQKGFFSRLFGR